MSLKSRIINLIFMCVIYIYKHSIIIKVLLHSIQQNTSTVVILFNKIYYIYLKCYVYLLIWISCQRPYHVENTGSRPITEVKQHRAQLVLWWVTAWERCVPLASQLFCSSFVMLSFCLFLIPCWFNYSFLYPLFHRYP